MVQNSKPERNIEGLFVSPPRVIIKFKEGYIPPYEKHIEGYDSIGKYIQEMDIGPWEEFSGKIPQISVNLIFTSIEPDTILELVEKAIKMNSSYEAPNFLSYFAVEFDETPENVKYEDLFEEMEKIKEELSSWEAIEFAYTQHGLGPLPAGPSSAQNDQMVNQGYLNSADQGVDAIFAWDQGGSGAGIDFIDIERGWDLEHQDIKNPPIPLLSGENKESIIHGTSTLGVVVGRDNGVNDDGTPNDDGIVGIAYEANAKVISVYPDPASCMGSCDANLNNAIMTALPHLNFGDVLLIEEQGIGEQIDIGGIPFWQLWPVEIDDLAWEIIHLGTTLGIIIIEPAGNGMTPDNTAQSVPIGTAGNDLSTFVTPDGKFILDQNNNNFMDSGGIIVGAATWGESPDYKHEVTVQNSPWAKPSNFGNRIDCFAWGERVWTSGGGSDTNPQHDAYHHFNGTSSASAIIAGVTLVIQSLAEANLSFRLGPHQMRSLLSNPIYGTPVTRNVMGLDLPEGYMPDLKKLLNNYFGNPHEDIYIRDNLADIGDSHSGPISLSPDIIVKNNPTNINNYINNPDLDDSETITGDTASIYIRAFNRGNAPANDVKVSLYYSEASTLITPASWNPIETEVSLGDIPEKSLTSDGLIVTRIPWNDIPGEGHYCFIGLVGNVNDPLIDPTDPTVVNFYNDFDNFRKFIRENNNATWKNFNVEPISGVGTGASGFMHMNFIVAGADDKNRPMGLEIGARLPEGARVWLQGRDEFLFNLQGKDIPHLEHNKEEKTAQILVNPHGPYLFKDTVFEKNLREELQLIVDLPKEHRDKPYEIFARQLYQGEEVGRVTWQLTPPDLIKVDGLTKLERRCQRFQWFIVGLLVLFVVIAGLHPFTSYLTEITLGFGSILLGFIWHRYCRPGRDKILKTIFLGLGIGIVLLAGIFLTGKF